MSLNIAKGQMYSFIDYTWNVIKGACYHNCKYCYMKRWGELKEIRFDEKELKTDLGENNFIFVGSSTDMFAQNIPSEWIEKILRYCYGFDNSYLFQSKNTKRMNEFIDYFPKNTVVCTTLETNRHYDEIFNNSPKIADRVEGINNLSQYFDTYVTIEPVIDFDIADFVYHLKHCNPKQVNIGADSGNNNLPEPSTDKIEKLIEELSKFTKVKLKNNLKRIYK